MTKKNAIIVYQSSGMLKRRPVRVAADQASATIATPHTKMTAIAIATTAAKRRIAACISVTRAGGSRTRAAGRRQNSMNAMPPTQTMTASRWNAFRVAYSTVRTPSGAA
jgi:hypothetical protein